MARNGSGVMSVPNPDFVSGTVIESDKVDANFSTIVDEITNSIAADGQTTPTANLPMGGFKLTGLGSGSSATDSVHLRDVQYQAWAWCGTAGGTADDITLSPSPALGAYAAGQVFRWKAGSNANTTAMTVNISSLGQINIQNDGSALTGGEHAANAFYEGVLDTTNTMQLRRISGDFIGVDVQAYDAGLADIAGLAVTDSNIIVGDGSNWVAESGNTARTSLGLGTGNTPRFTGLILQDSDAGTAVGPVMKLHRNSASPAANDNLAQLKWTGEDSAGNEADYAEIVADILDPTNGSEDGRLRLVALVGGSAVVQLYVADGLFTPNATGGAQGQNTINVSDYYRDGVVMGGTLIAVVEDQKTSGTAGGTFTSGADQTRDLNTEVFDLANAVTVGSNQITLVAGDYIIRWSAPAHRVNSHQSFLYDVTGTAEVERGTVLEAVNTSPGTNNVSTGVARVTPGSSNVYEIRHRCETSKTTDGFGVSGSFGTEVYTRVEIYAV